MPTREDMRTLGDEIVRSYDNRIAKIAQIKEAVNTELKEFDHAHQIMSEHMRAELAQNVAERRAAVHAHMKELAEIRAGARDEWHRLTHTMHGKRQTPAF